MKSAFAAAAPILIAAAMCSGCEALPENGPSAGSIVSGAIVTQRDDAQTPVLTYALVDISKTIIPYLVDPGAGSLSDAFGLGSATATATKTQTGDVLQVTIFESGAGGLFIPNDAGSRPGNFIQLPNQIVDGAGYITVPYAGQVKAAGRTMSEIQQDIVRKLLNRAIEPQVIVTQISQGGNQVTVVGEVGASTKMAINTAGDRVLDVLARASGLRNPGYETYITLERGKRRATVWFDAIVRNPNENIFVQPNDTIYVFRLQRSFTAFGATGASGQFKFDAPSISLADAVGKAGGLLDGRADPRQVFLYRLEDRDTLVKMGVDVRPFEPTLQKIATIFRTSFRDPSGFFAAQKFPMHDQDVIYVTNADKVELEKVLGIITDVAATAGTVSETVVSVNSARTVVKPAFH